MRRKILCSTLPLLFVAMASPLAAQDGKSPDPAKGGDHKKEMVAAAENAWAKPPVDEQSSTSKGSVTVRGQKIAYTATAGTLTIRDDSGKPTASVFYTAYTRDGVRSKNRPVTFLYNGGPGSATIWLRMGSFGPYRVATDSPIYVPPAQYSLAPNPDSLLDKTDLVFIDAVGAGYSRPLGDKTGKDFWGVDQDADAFARAIARYVAKNDRWNSPKFLFGESYGTLRSPVVGSLLEQRGISLNGIALLSTILNYGVRQPGYDQDYMGLLPTFAATAWYHNRIPNRPADLKTFLDEVRAFDSGAYAAALAKGDNISDAEKRQVAQQMSAYIGLSSEYIMRDNLRVSLWHFMTELLRDKGLSTGRLDTRYTLDVSDANAAFPDDDPASTAITGAYVASFRDYLSNRLGYKTDLPYKLSARDSTFDWDWSHEAAGERWKQNNPNTAVDLAATMRTNTSMKVLFLNGYYDAATPFYSTEFDAAHMMLRPELRKNISFTYYDAGHMIYLNPRALTRMHDDVAAWIDSATR
ncbi:peptidase S10 [Novosphingobium sp. ZN18A2]|uniref:S10 family peptidase n=1 Tax=Novosphingobium sp. ZN18A2 TaxID=3079861 RepID=UPI0030CCF981